MVVDRHVEVLPAGLAVGLAPAITGDAMAGSQDPSQLLAINVHELARPSTLIADDLLSRRSPLKPRAAVAAKRCMHR